MILYDNPASPFCRKVQVLARESGLIDEIEIAFAVGSPVADDQMPTDYNPLGKIPALVLEPGKTLFDSRVICRYLDDAALGTWYPTDQLFDVLTREALADGIMEAAVLMIYEVRCRDEGQRSDIWVEAQWAKVTRALDMFERDPIGARFDMGHIALACALGYLDFRHGDRHWRGTRPALAAWFKDASLRPSLAETVPHA